MNTTLARLKSLRRGHVRLLAGAACVDYLVAVVFLRSAHNFTLPIGLETFFQQDQTDWGPVMAVAVVMMVPPIIVFAVLNRFFSVGGIGGSLAGK